jgi:hypothetical protein
MLVEDCETLVNMEWLLPANNGVATGSGQDNLFINSTFVGNSAFPPTDFGGTISFGSDSNIGIYNCIFYNNSPGRIFTMHIPPNFIPPRLYIGNTILEGGLSSVVIYSGVIGVDLLLDWGEGNLDTDPLFDNNSGEFPYQLCYESPAIGGGTLDIPGYTFPETDIMGNPRVINGSVDMGAYQFQGIWAGFTATPVSGEAPLEVQFTDQSRGEVSAWLWYFGDAMQGISTEQYPSYTYTEPGSYTVTLVINSGERRMQKVDFITVTERVSEKEENVTPYKTALIGNYPNPFNPETNISFTLAEDIHVKIDIFNIKGQKVAVLTDKVFASGKHNVVWKGRNMIGQNACSGVYYYKMTAGEYKSINKMILLK